MIWRVIIHAMKYMKKMDFKNVTKLTRTAGQIAVGGRMWSRNSPMLHSGLTWEAHLLWSCYFGTIREREWGREGRMEEKEGGKAREREREHRYVYCEKYTYNVSHTYSSCNSLKNIRHQFWLTLCFYI